jgi:tRNA(His) guanylyltransferase
MKARYERPAQTELPRRTYTLLRIDGKAFHTYTRGCRRPYDRDLMADLDTTAALLCQEIDGARLGFVQSDEISLLLADVEKPGAQTWFDGNVQKIASVSASLATAHFNAARLVRGVRTLACFDARVWTIPEPGEVANYFVWRQQDALRNSLSMAARAYFSHERCHGLSSSELAELLLLEAGLSADDLPVGFRRGRVIVRESTERAVVYTDRRTGDRKTAVANRSRWISVEPPVFTQERAWLLAKIPAAL